MSAHRSLSVCCEISALLERKKIHVDIRHLFHWGSVFVAGMLHGVVRLRRYKYNFNAINFGGVSHQANFGVTNVYDAARIDGLNLYYERFNVYLVGYIISGITFILLIIYITGRNGKKKIITKR